MKCPHCPAKLHFLNFTGTERYCATCPHNPIIWIQNEVPVSSRFQVVMDDRTVLVFYNFKTKVMEFWTDYSAGNNRLASITASLPNSQDILKYVDTIINLPAFL